MKKLIMLSIAALLTAGFIGCGSEEEDSSKADLKWNNQAGTFVQDIKWISDGNTDQSWDGQTDNNTETVSKGITKLSGSGDCIDDGGDTATITLDIASSSGATGTSGAATIEENAAATLVISGTAKK